MVKKSCEKHEKFNYYCEDCQEANRKYEIQQKVKRLERGEFDRIEGPRKPPIKRFLKSIRFKKPRVKKYLKIIIPVAVITLILLTIFWFWPAWFGPINLNAQLYANKAGGLNYYDFYFLNFWSINFFLNKTALVGAFIGCLIMSGFFILPNRNLLTIIGTKLRFGKPSRKKSLLFWWTAGFILFYLIGMALDFNGQFSWVLYLYEKGQISLSPLTIFTDALDVLLNTNNMNIEFIFVYTRLYLPLIYFIFGVFIFRLILNIASNYYLKRNDFNIASNAMIMGGLILGLLFFTLPTFALNGVQVIQMWSLILAFFALIGSGISLYIYGRIKLARDPTKRMILNPRKIRVGILASAIIIVILIPMIMSIGPSITLSNTAVYSEYEWTKKIQREILWTRECAGLDMFEERSIENFTLSSNPENDTQMISRIRQYDQEFAVQSLAAKIGTTFEGLADSDIVYIDGKEYWVAPKTIRISQFSGDPVKTNTELYDHIEGFLALDTFTGELVNVTSVFNVSDDYPIFFGESESQKFLEQQGSSGGLGAYDSAILLNTNWSGGIPNNKYVYEGEPDGSLSGLDAFWYTINLGLWGYVFEGGEKEFLFNRNVKSRVANILLPQLSIDYDPYLVFNGQEGKVYYAVSIFTRINIGSYANSPILRFLGISLIDVKNGDMTFYINPNLEGIDASYASSDPTYPLWKYYMSVYDWQIAPPWLKNQLRYPETLFELQLTANYMYHVRDLKTWKRGDDFHERPENGDLFYIETNLGDGIEYVGLDLVEYRGTEARTLAGMYIIRHGTNFGEAIFYHTRDSTENLIGPKTARDTYETEATQEISLISGAKNGNTLLYPLGGSVYYYIPTYSSVGGLQQLKLAGFVDAFTRNVGYGSEAIEAYNNLGNIEPGAFTLTTDAGNPDIDGDFVLNWTESLRAETYSIYRNDSLLINVPSSQTTYSISELGSGDYEFYIEASNEFGNTTSTSDPHPLIVVVDIVSINYDFNMENSMILPDALASFRIELENFNESLGAPGHSVQVNLSLYRVGGGNFSILVSPNLYPLENATYGSGNYTGITFTLINTTLYSGEGIILNGFVISYTADITIRFKWFLIVDSITIYTSEEGLISVS
ncbi:MAG: UPF0182 family protein [Candidatus Lokiarchaeota archaeon]|nr:UPF0182 family protein [Candidatus Lokiarchaeota archaeon]